MEQNMLTVKALTLNRGARQVLTNLNLTLDAGRVLIVTGGNGAGKTTLLRAVAGLLPPYSGGISIDGIAPKEANPKMVYIGHRDGLSGALTADENIRFWANSRGLFPSQQHLTTAFSWLGLNHLREVETRYLSEGQRRRTGLVRLALSHVLSHHGALSNNGLWLMDEPLTAMDKNASDQLTALIDAHSNAGGSAILTTHIDIKIKRSNLIDLDAEIVAGR